MENMKNYLNDLLPSYAKLTTYNISEHSPFRKYSNFRVQFKIFIKNLKISESGDDLERIRKRTIWK